MPSYEGAFAPRLPGSIAHIITVLEGYYLRIPHLFIKCLFFYYDVDFI